MSVWYCVKMSVAGFGVYNSPEAMTRGRFVRSSVG
jgi:hypothetical protein